MADSVNVAPLRRARAMSARTVARRLFCGISSRITSRASVTGIPARRNTAIWRENCIRSLRGTRFLVISNCRMLLCSTISVICRSRSKRARPAPVRVSPSITPRASLPSGFRAVYLNFGIVLCPSARVDDPDDFGNGGDVVVDEGETLLEQGAHPLGDGHAADLLLGGPPDDEALHLGGDPEELVDADAVFVAGPAAEVAAFAGPELVLVRPAGLQPEGELL